MSQFERIARVYMDHLWPWRRARERGAKHFPKRLREVGDAATGS